MALRATLSAIFARVQALADKAAVYTLAVIRAED
jgi:hypothetical protein